MICCMPQRELMSLKTRKITLLMVLSDAVHAILCDSITGMGAHLVLLKDVDRICGSLSWQANKIKHVVRSTTAAETLSLHTGLEVGIYLHKHLEELLGSSVNKIPLSAFVDNKNVLEASHSTKKVNERRLRIDTSTVQESL